MGTPDRNATIRLRPLPRPTGNTCPQCGAPLVERHGLFGRYVGCARYPRCAFTAGGTFRPVKFARRR